MAGLACAQAAAGVGPPWQPRLRLTASVVLVPCLQAQGVTTKGDRASVLQECLRYIQSLQAQVAPLHSVGTNGTSRCLEAHTV